MQPQSQDISPHTPVPDHPPLELFAPHKRHNLRHSRGIRELAYDIRWEHLERDVVFTEVGEQEECQRGRMRYSDSWDDKGQGDALVGARKRRDGLSGGDNLRTEHASVAVDVNRDDIWTRPRRAEARQQMRREV